MVLRTITVVTGQCTEGRQGLVVSVLPGSGLSAPELGPLWAVAEPGRPLFPTAQAILCGHPLWKRTAADLRAGVAFPLLLSPAAGCHQARQVAFARCLLPGGKE